MPFHAAVLLIAFLAIGCNSSTTPQQTAAQAPARRPNVLFIMADDFRAGLEPDEGSLIINQ